VPRLTPGGVIAVDNVLRRGQVAAAEPPDQRTTVIRRFNDHVRADPRTDSLIVPIGDGLGLITLAA
jgi:caffeoyl-CoA O-methyltransferase